MGPPRISASSYLNTAPLVWSFISGTARGRAELLLDTAPARSAELLTFGRVDAALVPIIAYQRTAGLRLVPDVCVGARKRVMSVCLVTDGIELSEVRSVALDTSSHTSVALTKIIFREFFEREPDWLDAAPIIDEMLSSADAALIIGDPAFSIAVAAEAGSGNRRVFDLAELWDRYTGLGFVFAMWMTQNESLSIDFRHARDEGLEHIEDIAASYAGSLRLDPAVLAAYLRENIAYSIDDSMRRGMELYFELAAKHSLTPANRPLMFAA